MKGKFPTKLSTKYITKFSTFFLISIITFFALSCRKYERFFGFVNKSTTLDITSNPKSVTFEAEFIDTGSYEIISQGHIWSNKRDVPTFAKDNVVPSAKTSVQFSTKIENILPDTNYFARAFAITSANDTLYTPVVSKRWTIKNEVLKVISFTDLGANSSEITIRVALNVDLLKQINTSIPNNTFVFELQAVTVQPPLTIQLVQSITANIPPIGILYVDFIIEKGTARRQDYAITPKISSPPIVVLGVAQKINF